MIMNEIMDDTCKVNALPTVREILGNNFQLMCELERKLYMISNEIKKDNRKDECSNEEVNDMLSAVEGQNKILVECLNHCNRIMENIGL